MKILHFLDSGGMNCRYIALDLQLYYKFGGIDENFLPNNKENYTHYYITQQMRALRAKDELETYQSKKLQIRFRGKSFHGPRPRIQKICGFVDKMY